MHLAKVKATPVGDRRISLYPDRVEKVGPFLSGQFIEPISLVIHTTISEVDAELPNPFLAAPACDDPPERRVCRLIRSLSDFGFLSAQAHS
jgi:hypothetical protein